MVHIQEIFNRLEETKRKQKEIRKAYKEALANSSEYQEIVEKIKVLRDRRKQIEDTVRADFSSEFTKLDDYKIDIASDMELLSDAALTQLMKGETVEIKDEYDNKYEPVFSVKFKKA